MAEEQNIFEAAAGKSKAKKKKERPAEPPKPKSSVIPQIKGDPETAEMLSKIRKMQTDLEQKFDALYKKAKMSPLEFQAYLDNPKNFSPKDWEFVKTNRELLEEQVWDTIGMELKPTKLHKRENVKGERKGKTLGARKKWIPMQ